MVKKHVSVLLALLLMVGSFGLLGARAEEGETSALRRLLALVPIEAMASGHLSYADHAGLLALQEDGEAEEVALKLARGTSTGAFDVLLSLRMAQEVEAATGFNPFGVAQSLEAGQAPARLVALAGDISSEAVEAALTAKQYEPIEGWPGLWSPDGDLTLGLLVNLGERDAAFLFGGMMGGRWPVLVHDGSIVASPQGGYLVSQGESALALPDVRAFLAALKDSETDVHQLMMMPLREGHVLVAQVDSAQKQEVLLLLHGQPEEELRALLEKGKGIVEDAKLNNGRSLQALLDEQGGEAQQPELVQTEDGPVYRLAVRFPQKDLAGYSAWPFRLIQGMLMKWDLGWLMAPQ